MTSVVRLNDGRALPSLGLGVFRLSPKETRRSVETALGVGYRHIDTAAAYGNEASVGEAVRASNLGRGDVWVTTKLWNNDQGKSRVRPAFEKSLERLQLDYVDLYLLHWPHELRLESWEELVSLRERGLARSIGVSNFLVPHLDELLTAGLPTPAVNQIEMSPFLYRTRTATVERTTAAGIVVEAYSPLTKGVRLDSSALSTIAARSGRSPAQVLLRWSIQKGFVPLPRSSSPERIAHNADVFGFSLSADDIAVLDALDEGLTTGWDPASALG